MFWGGWLKTQICTIWTHLRVFALWEAPTCVQKMVTSLIVGLEQLKAYTSTTSTFNPKSLKWARSIMTKRVDGQAIDAISSQNDRSRSSSGSGWNFEITLRRLILIAVIWRISKDFNLRRLVLREHWLLGFGFWSKHFARNKTLKSFFAKTKIWW